jgi:hypothetical protein
LAGMSEAARSSKNGKTYNTRDSPVVTHPSTNLAIIGLSHEVLVYLFIVYSHISAIAVAVHS